jgi:hypothetical protein
MTRRAPFPNLLARAGQSDLRRRPPCSRPATSIPRGIPPNFRRTVSSHEGTPVRESGISPVVFPPRPAARGLRSSRQEAPRVGHVRKRPRSWVTRRLHGCSGTRHGAPRAGAVCTDVPASRRKGHRGPLRPVGTSARGVARPGRPQGVPPRPAVCHVGRRDLVDLVDVLTLPTRQWNGGAVCGRAPIQVHEVHEVQGPSVDAR